jgi:exosortase/archaeosortase family protein
MATKVGIKSLLIYCVLSISIIVAVYYLPNYLFLETAVANNSSYLLSYFGQKAPVHFENSSVLIGSYTVARDCTGIQVIAVFLGLILPLPRVPFKKKIISLAFLGTMVYISNIFRLILEYYLVANEILPWSLAHYPLSLVFGIIGVFLLVLVNNKLIPEFGEYVFTLTSRFTDLFSR